MQCIQNSIWNSYKNGLTDRDAVLDKNKEPCIRWGADPPRRRGNFRGLSGPFLTSHKQATIWNNSCVCDRPTFVVFVVLYDL